MKKSRKNLGKFMEKSWKNKQKKGKIMEKSWKVIKKSRENHRKIRE